MGPNLLMKFLQVLGRSGIVAKKTKEINIAELYSII